MVVDHRVRESSRRSIVGEVIKAARYITRELSNSSEISQNTGIGGNVGRVVCGYSREQKKKKRKVEERCCLNRI